MEKYERKLSSSSDGVFGKILTLSSASATIVFISVLIFFLLFEAVLHVFEVACNKRGFKGLVKKLYREFMIMGLISFAIYIASEAYNFPNDDWFSAFHFAHIVIVFIGITFLIQAALLVRLVSARNLVLLRYANSTSEELILEYVSMYKEGGIRMFLFDHGPVSIPFPELREKIEYKILQQFFIKVYNLPHEFKFANYMCLVLKDYVISLVEVRPISWLIMTCFVALNYLKITIIDPVYQHSVCEKYPDQSHDDHVDDHVDDHGYVLNTHTCDEYTLRYTCFVLLLIGLFLVGVLIASEIYMKRLIDIVLDQQATEGLMDGEGSPFDPSTSRTSLTKQPSQSAKRRSTLIGIGGGRRASVQNGTSDGVLAADIPAVVTEGGGVGGDIEMANVPAPSHPKRPDFRRQSSGADLDSELPGIRENRRNRYLDGLEKLMSVEYNHHMDLARRMSTADESGTVFNLGSGPIPTAAAPPPTTKPSSAKHQPLSSSNKTGSFLGFNLGGSHHPPVHQTGNGRDSTSSVPGDTRPPTGEELRARFQRMQTLGKELTEIKQAELNSPNTRRRSSSQDIRNRSSTAAAAAPTATSERFRSGSKFFSFPHHDRHDSVSYEEGNKHSSRGRGYSVQYFDLTGNVSQSIEQPPTTLSGRILNTMKSMGVILHNQAKHFGSMLVEHHIGRSKVEVGTDEDVKLLQKQFNQIFLCSQPEFYYHSVEMALLMQCVYIALWATNFVQMAQNSHFPVRWHILLVFPLPIYFFLLKQIIFTSCMLKSILSLDKFISDKICEDAVDELNVTQRLRKLIRSELKKEVPELDKQGQKLFLKEKFANVINYRDRGIEGVNEKHLKLYLHSLQIFLTDTSISRIFSVIDFDKDGVVTWENLSRIIFPDLQNKKVKLKKRKSIKDEKRLSFDVENFEAFSRSLQGAALLEHLHPDLKYASYANNSPEFTALHTNLEIDTSESPTTRGSLLSQKNREYTPRNNTSFRSVGNSPKVVVGEGNKGEILYFTAEEEAAQYGIIDGTDGDIENISSSDSGGNSSDESEYNTNGPEFIGSKLVLEVDDDQYDSEGSLREEESEKPPHYLPPGSAKHNVRFRETVEREEEKKSIDEVVAGAIDIGHIHVSEIVTQEQKRGETVEGSELEPSTRESIGKGLVDI